MEETIEFKFETLKEGLYYIENYFKSCPQRLLDDSFKIYFSHNFYYLILNKWSFEDE